MKWIGKMKWWTVGLAVVCTLILPLAVAMSEMYQNPQIVAIALKIAEICIAGGIAGMATFLLTIALEYVRHTAIIDAENKKPR